MMHRIPTATRTVLSRRSTAAIVSTSSLRPASRQYVDYKDYEPGYEKPTQQSQPKEEGNADRDQPSILSGHANYVKGRVEEVLGSVFGSEALKKAGQEDREAGVSEMKAADQGPKDNIMPGGLERTIGKAIGCDGLVEHGEEKLKKKQPRDK